MLGYVAFTRAKEELITTHAADYGGKILRARSEFLSEAFDLGKPVPPGRRRRAMEELEAHIVEGPDGLPRLERPAAREPIHLSHQRIADYDTCPLKYHFLHVLSVDPILTMDHRVNFGNAMHQAVAFALDRTRLGTVRPSVRFLRCSSATGGAKGTGSQDKAGRDWGR